MRELDNAVVELPAHVVIATKGYNRTGDRSRSLIFPFGNCFAGKIYHRMGGGLAPDLLVFVEVSLAERFAVDEFVCLCVLVGQSLDKPSHGALEILGRDVLGDIVGVDEIGEPGHEIPQTVVEVVVFGLAERHLPEQLDGDGMLFQELRHRVVLVPDKARDRIPGDFGIAEAQRLPFRRLQHLRADALGGVYGTCDLRPLQLRLRGKPRHRNGLLRDGDAVSGAERAREVLHDGAAQFVDRAPEQ